MDTKITTPTPVGALSGGGFRIEGMETLGRSDVILPRKTILQPSSKREGEAGDFYDNLTRETVAQLDVVILSITHTRTLWGDDLAVGKPECTSLDAITGSYGTCVACSFNPEVDHKLWNKGVKRCSLGYLFLCCDRLTDAMFVFTANKTSARPARVLLSQLVLKRKPVFSAVVRFATKKEQNSQGKFYTFLPSIAEDLPGVDVARYREMYLAMKGVPIRDVEDVGDMPDAPDSDPVYQDGEPPF